MAETTRAPVDVFEKARAHDRKEQLEAAKAPISCPTSA